MEQYTIAWEVFFTEEQAALRKAIELGQRSLLTQCIVEMSPQKEAELQKLMNQMSPEVSDSESSVMKKYQIDRLKQGLDPSPQTPEEEASLQKLLDEEQLEKQKKFTEKLQSTSDVPSVPEVEEKEVKETEKPKATWKKV